VPPVLRPSTDEISPFLLISANLHAKPIRRVELSKECIEKPTMINNRYTLTDT